jgi:hypothetical protein
VLDDGKLLDALCAGMITFALFLMASAVTMLLYFVFFAALELWFWLLEQL